MHAAAKINGRFHTMRDNTDLRFLNFAHAAFTRTRSAEILAIQQLSPYLPFERVKTGGNQPCLSPRPAGIGSEQMNLPYALKAIAHQEYQTSGACQSQRCCSCRRGGCEPRYRTRKPCRMQQSCGRTRKERAVGVLAPNIFVSNSLSDVAQGYLRGSIFLGQHLNRRN